MHISPQRGLNSRPLVYKTNALPLSYKGIFIEKGLTRESNSEPLAPKARIIPLDQRAKVPRLGIEPRAIAWKATMLPLHQRGLK